MSEGSGVSAGVSDRVSAVLSTGSADGSQSAVSRLAGLCWQRVGRLHMGWSRVCFLNYPVEPDRLRPHVPPGLAIDTFDGDAWLSVVPYTNVDVRPAWAPAGTGVALPELNLRTYVTPTREDAGAGAAAGSAGADRPARHRSPTAGVYFLSLDADGLAGVLGARLFHRLAYYNAGIDLAVRDDGRTRFACRRRHPGARAMSFRATYGPTGEGLAVEPDSLPAFLVERYRYYTEASDGGLRYAEVAHEPWELFRAEHRVDRNDLFAANGLPDPAAAPVAYYSPGVDTVAGVSRRI